MVQITVVVRLPRAGRPIKYRTNHGNCVFRFFMSFTLYSIALSNLNKQIMKTIKYILTNQDKFMGAITAMLVVVLVIANLIK